MPRSSWSSNLAVPPNNLPVRKFDAALAPCGRRRDSVRSVPWPRACTSYVHTLRFCGTRNARRRPGSNSITFDVVGQCSHPARLILMVFVPTPTGVPKMIILRHCGLRSPMRRKSLTMDHTRCGSASISMLTSISSRFSVMVSPGSYGGVISDPRLDRVSTPGGQPGGQQLGNSLMIQESGTGQRGRYRIGGLAWLQRLVQSGEDKSIVDIRQGCRGLAGITPPSRHFSADPFFWVNMSDVDGRCAERLTGRLA